MNPGILLADIRGGKGILKGTEKEQRGWGPGQDGLLEAEGVSKQRVKPTREADGDKQTQQRSHPTLTQVCTGHKSKRRRTRTCSRRLEMCGSCREMGETSSISPVSKGEAPHCAPPAMSRTASESSPGVQNLPRLEGKGAMGSEALRGDRTWYHKYRH